MPAADASTQIEWPTVEEDHALLCQAIRDAAGEVMARYKNAATKSWKKGDASLVSEADLQANEILKAALLANERSAYGWLSEESADDPNRLEAARTWIIDPIDGTRAFLKGRPEFTVCGALLHGDRVVSSVIFNPVTDEFFEATLGGGAFCNGDPIRAGRCSALTGCRILAWSGHFAGSGWPQPWPKMDYGYRNSTSYRMALVAKGEADAAIALVPKADWDIAMGALIVSEAGGVASDHRGDPFVFNQRRPVQRALVCATQGLYPAVIDRLRHLPADLRPKPIDTTKGASVTDENQQLLHLVFGGELEATDSASFKDLDKLDIVGVFPNYAEAEKAWRAKAQQTVDSAQTRYFIVHLHRLLDPDGDGKLG